MDNDLLGNEQFAHGNKQVAQCRLCKVHSATILSINTAAVIIWTQLQIELDTVNMQVPHKMLYWSL